jgi:predicted Zn-dependent peptidase
MTTEIFKTNNGITVANIKNESSMALFGIVVLAGSNYETPEVAGIGHYVEHVGFKGSEKRNWKQINEEFAKMGSSPNAYTSNSEIFYHSACPKESIPQAIELMSDLFFNSTIPVEEMEKERNVIIEEKKMYEDDPKGAFTIMLGEKFFQWNIGHDVIGTFDSIKSITRQQILDYKKDKTSLDNFVFICSGNIDSKDLKKYIEDNTPKEHIYLRSVGTNDLAGGMWTDIINKEDKVKFLLEKENITQSMVYMMMPALSADDSMYYSEAVLYKACGGGMYSRLFSKIREELGLCYSVGMYGQSLSYPDRRIANLYGYTSPENVDLFIEESEKVLKEVMKNGLDQNIFECAKTDYLASVLRHTETSVGKAMYLVNKLLVNKKGNIEDIVKGIREVKIENCNKLAEKLLNQQYNWAVMNPKKA